VHTRAQFGQSHRHDHGSREVTADNARRVLLALLLTGGFMLVEVVGGLLTGSLALIADAGHMLTDTAALAFAWMAFRVARRPNDARRTYGYHRFQVLAAFVNGVTLVAVVGWIMIEAVRRLFAPVEVLGGPMLVIAVIGLLVNLTVLWILRGGDRANLNIQGAAVRYSRSWSPCWCCAAPGSSCGARRTSCWRALRIGSTSRPCAAIWWRPYLRWTTSTTYTPGC
jgi:cobalt-zinc-cadmium efflux system protein